MTLVGFFEQASPTTACAFARVLVSQRGYRSGNLPDVGRLAADKIAVELAKFELQFFERLPLNILVRRALRTAAPLTLILPDSVFRHVSEYSCKSKFRTEFCKFPTSRAQKRDGNSSVRG